ncbi:1-deoxy-D-xylulose-5-phosphate reductoisomerase [Iocasia frigidifontis]|uniref:1-deoxy-D-xylulose 5-phosphate reductoisomerase n=1 Tax=Iocasia fonsfrigidae TaxID=2682810 RepID=A0A8A7KAZ9_9FIRM|nr:1-deoxy-D-xylulose-5-phosphate reductoisomerase [Iocasia fonsfrigidae]QTL98420.1 1-deoxy-D-xylulose-5-phosphate reductoisomerase [Iocasia fonsfrigidae]
MKRIIILGSTGSIGTQTLEVIEHLSDDWNVIGLTANTNIDLLEKQANKYKPEFLVVMDEYHAKKLKNRLADQAVEVLSGPAGLNYLAGQVESDLLINALVGAVGLAPTVAALEKGSRIGLANKETLVIGGQIIEKYLSNPLNKILPIDSEHNAVFQLLAGHKEKEIAKIILTASGGPFLNLEKDRLETVTVKEALNHPNWDMGGKITIDSATMMNKGLEVIEAHYLFKQPYDKIKVVIHPESIVHSMVEFIDSSIMAELGVADMRIPIQNILTYPERVSSLGKNLDLFTVGALNFEEPDFEKFPALGLAYTAGKEGGSLPVILNAANEVAVMGFLANKIRFTDITYIVEKVMDSYERKDNPLLEEIYMIDKEAREMAEGVMKECY